MIKEIPTAELKPGMYVEKFGDSWQNHPFWRSSFKVKSKAEIDKVSKHGIQRVWIDTSRGDDIAEDATQCETPQRLDQAPAPANIEPAKGIPTAAKKPSLKQELSRARKICESSRDAVTLMFQEARMGKAIELRQAASLVDDIAASVWRNPSALISVARLKNQDDYTYMHSVAVCALMIALGKEMGLNEDQLQAVGVGGLVHDIGKVSVPLGVLNKPGKLTDEEFRIVKSHPEKGYELLLAGGAEVGQIPLDITLHHHEKINGFGYPHKLAKDKITVFARMGAICDVYDAITSNRPYKEGWDPATSLKRMASWEGHFDSKLFQTFVKTIGIYPVGSLVSLESEKIGIVVEPGESSLLTPKVKTFFSLRSRETVPVEIVDLATSNRDRIKRVENAAEWGFKDLDQFWNET